MKNEKTDDPPKGSLNILRGLGFFEVGDAVYYKAPKPSYAVRKSTVVEVVTYAQNFNQNGYVILCHWNRSCPWDIRVFGGQKGLATGGAT